MLLSTVAAPAGALAGDDWGELQIDLRYRLESVDDDDPTFTDDALASTLRTAVLYTSPEWNAFSAFVEFEDVSDVGADDLHNNGGLAGLGNGVTDRPAVPDPNVTEVSQAAARYTGLRDATFELGRLEVNLGTQRFVGAVGWRQNHQTLDGFRVAHRPRKTIGWAYVFANNANRVFGDNKTMTSHLANAEIQIRDAGKLTPYIYALDYDDMADAGLSTTTFGARWQGRHDCRGPWSLAYHAEAARQNDAGDNPGNVDAGYYHVALRGKRERLWLEAGFEALEGSSSDGQFTTPLATLHKFNGWADKFAGGTPTDGLEDLYVGVGGRAGPVGLTAIFHDFSAESSSVDYGQEIDLQASWVSSWKQVFGLKIAAYDADDLAFDTFKLMLWSSHRFSAGG
jgi:hypothetical protein